ncbi:MAG: MG2 domain-containing protein, partial [Myxococcota bacterium]|nr:MG2 domain-containing protein [Myxococcota bacterium]
AIPTKPLALPQITPQGEIAAESEVRIRFDEPMVPVAAVGSTAKPKQPFATIAPAIAGTWRWIDTRVLTFTVTPRFPQATEITVTVPPGVRALSGATLATAATTTFTTPPLALAGTWPPTQLRPDSPVLVKLDQDFDADQIIPLLRVTDQRHRKLAFRKISMAEATPLWAKNPSIQLDLSQVGWRYVILAPVTAWPADTEAQVVLAAKAPSREGPRLSTRESFARFDVAPAFTVRGISCDEHYDPRMTGRRCGANGHLDVQFANPIAQHSYRSRKVQIAGMPFADHTASGSSVGIGVPAEVGRTYSIAIAGDLVDVYGQPLVGPRDPSFTTTRERFLPQVTAPTGLVVLDPRFEIPQWVVRAEAVIALRVQLFAVTPADYFAYEAYERGERATPPGRRLLDKTYAVGARQGAELRTDLRPALNRAGTGHVIAVLTADPAGAKHDWFTPKHVAWIQVTKLGVVARTDGEEVHAWVQDITPGSAFLRPSPGALTTLVVEGRADASTPVASDASGHVSFALPGRRDNRQPVRGKQARQPSALLQVQSATDTAFVAVGGEYEKAIRHHDARWYVTDDRFTYKPGEKVYVKGWVRWSHDGRNPDLVLPATGDVVTYQLADPRGNKLATGTAALTAQGGFDLEVTLPPNVNLGTASFTFETKQQVHRHAISIQEFRTPAYAVTLNDDVTHAGATPLILGERIEMLASAKYYSGGGLPGAGLAWSATLSPASYRPPGWDELTFTPPAPRSSQQTWRGRKRVRSGGAITMARDTTLSGASAASIAYGITALPDNAPSVLAVDATVADVDRMRIRASSRPILVHPSAYYVGVRLKPETSDVLEAIVTDIDGTVVPGVPIDITLDGVLGSERYRDDAKLVITHHCAVKSQATPVTCRWTRDDLKIAFTATARVADPRGRANVTQYEVPWYAPESDREDLAIVPDRPSYRPGDVAKLELRSQVIPATALVTFARGGVIGQQRIELTKPSTIVELPIQPSHLKNVHVLVDRWARQRKPPLPNLPPLVEHTRTAIDLAVDVESARLSMRTRALRPLVEPGAEATFEVEVKHRGKPAVGAEVALIVVDEAILALSAGAHADPLAPFYRDVPDGTTAHSSLQLLQDSAEDLAGKPGFSRYRLADGHGGFGYGSLGSGEGGGGFGYGSGTGTGIVVARKDFRPTAAFSPRLLTDARGKVRLTVTMPDSLTRFRVVALATSETRYFGKAENTIVTQRTVNARTVAPRFLNQGDTFALPIVVQNLDTAPRTVDVAVRAANLASIGATDPGAGSGSRPLHLGKRITIPGGQRAEVRFDFTTVERGRAVIQTIATSGDFADASTVELPVYEPATTEAFATYGIVDEAPQFERLEVPADIFPDVGGVEVELASTQLQSLTDAFWYLYAYPYECAEQRSARMLATAAMFDILDAFATPGRPTRHEIAETIAADLRKLAKDQLSDGGWGYFNGMTSDPFVTMQVLMALAAHRQTGPVIKRATAFVHREATALLTRLDKAVAKPPADRRDRDQHGYAVSLAATALAALATTGTDVRGRASRLHAVAVALGAYPIDAKARVLAMLAKHPAAQPARTKLLADLLSATHETAAAATVTARYQEAERLLLVSINKTTALALDALMREAPEHALVPKLARGVLDARRGGRWSTTQENLVVLATMRRFFDTYEKATPNYQGKLWFGRAAYAEQAFVGRSGVRGQVAVDWTKLPAGSLHDLALEKTGPGRMYYRVGITYAPRRTDLPALDAGFVVRRSYTAVDDPADLVKLPDGRWKVKLGARVLVTIEALNTTLRHAVAVVDPLPAGFEAVNDNLATSERTVATIPDTRWDFRNMRDSRSEVFAMQLREGSHRFTYTARATTPGTFFAAPAKAEEMYGPETFGRSAGQTIVIE